MAALTSAGGDIPKDSGTNNPTPAKKSIKIDKVTAKKNITKITDTVSVSKATVKIKVGKKATVSGKIITLQVANRQKA